MALLIDHGAFCALSFRDNAFRFRDVEQVRRGLERIGTDNLIEESLVLDDLDGINRECHYQQVRVRLQKIQVRHGKPRYVLMERPERVV